jgi:hypothetical protein
MGAIFYDRSYLADEICRLKILQIWGRLAGLLGQPRFGIVCDYLKKGLSVICRMKSPDSFRSVLACFSPLPRARIAPLAPHTSLCILSLFLSFQTALRPVEPPSVWLFSSMFRIPQNGERIASKRWSVWKHPWNRGWMFDSLYP